MTTQIAHSAEPEHDSSPLVSGDLREDASPAEVPSPARDAYIDNIKGILIVLVVAGHVIGRTLTSFPPGMTLYYWIYLFHMPAFVLVAGIMTSGRDLGGKQVRSLIRTVALPYVIAQLAYMLLLYLSGRSIGWGVNQVLHPIFQLWFLPALFLWRLSAPFLLRIRPVIPFAIVVSLLAPLSTVLGAAFALNRVAGLLPFFAVGLMLGRGSLSKRPPMAVRVASWGVLAASIPLAVLFEKVLSRHWLYWTHSYRALHVGALEGMGTRAALLAIVFLVTGAFIVLVPRRRTFVTGLGRWSMYPYVLHGALVWAFAWEGLASQIRTPWAFGLMLVGVVIVTAVLASRPIRLLFKPLISPKADWLILESGARRGRGA